MSHPKRESHPESQQKCRNPREKGEMGGASLDDGAQSAAGAHQHTIEMLRGKAEFPAQLLLVDSV